MSVDYQAVGGVGVALNHQFVCDLVANKQFTLEQWQKNKTQCLDNLKISYSSAGSCYSGDIHFYFLVEGETLNELMHNAPIFIDKLMNIGIQIQMEDIKLINDIYVF